MTRSLPLLILLLLTGLAYLPLREAGFVYEDRNPEASLDLRALVVASIGPAPRFHLSDPPIGPCNKTLQSNGFYPWINLKTGAEWFCDNGSTTVYASAWRVVYPYLLGTVAASR